MSNGAIGRAGSTRTSAVDAIGWPSGGGVTARHPLGRAFDSGLGGRAATALRSIATDLEAGGVRIALALAACIAMLGALGAAHALVMPLSPFNVEGELSLSQPMPEALNFPALFSGALLFSAAGLAIATARGSRRFPWLALAGFFAFMGVDELAGVHEWVGHQTGIPWELPYLPIALAGGVLWLFAAALMQGFESERLLWLGGAFAWVFAQVLEVGEVAGGDGWMPLARGLGGLSEIFEMAGSSLFLLALYLVCRRISGERTSGRHHTRAEDAIQLRS